MWEGLAGVIRHQRALGHSGLAVGGPHSRAREVTERGGATTDSAEDAARDLQAALEHSGFASMRMCATGDISPAALRAIAVSIRSLESGE